MAKKITLESLAAIMSKGFAAADKNFTALAEDIAEIKTTMATKEDVLAIVRKEVKPIASELGVIRRDVEKLEEQFKNVLGFRKEIDCAFQRIAAIGHAGRPCVHVSGRKPNATFALFQMA